MKLTLTQRDRALDAAVDDFFAVARFGREQPWGRHEPHTKRIVVALAFNADSPRQWARLALHVLTELGYTEQERMLTAEERRIRLTAERLYDICIKRVRLGTREEEKQLLDEAYDRALFQLRKRKDHHHESFTELHRLPAV